MRLLVTGSRYAGSEHYDLIRQHLAEAARVGNLLPYSTADNMIAGLSEGGGRVVTLISGHCHTGGVDLIAETLAELWNWDVERYPADWTQGHRGGPIRNARMVATGADQCVAFPAPGSTGTWDCVRKAVAAGIPTHVYQLPPTRSSSPPPVLAPPLDGL